MANTTPMWTKVTCGALLLCVLFPANAARAQVESSRRGDRDSLLEKAEALREKAVALRRVQTNESLTMSRALFDRSARLFATAHANKEAADAYLGVADIDILFGKYGKARRVYGEV